MGEEKFTDGRGTWRRGVGNEGCINSLFYLSCLMNARYKGLAERDVNAGEKRDIIPVHNLCSV